MFISWIRDVVTPGGRRNRGATNSNSNSNTPATTNSNNNNEESLADHHLTSLSTTTTRTPVNSKLPPIATPSTADVMSTVSRRRRSSRGSTSAKAAAAAMPSTKTRSTNNKTAATKDKDPEDPNAPVTPADLWQTIDRQLRLNIGTSVKCGICLSTVSNPVRTPCVHSFCQDCLAASLIVRKACPECNSPISKRGLQHFGYLQDMANAYKECLTEFGYTPGKYDASFTTLTQKVCYTSQDDLDDEDKNSEQARFDRLCVATTWKGQALPVCQDIKDMQRDENDQVVRANLEACNDFYLKPYLKSSKKKPVAQDNTDSDADTGPNGTVKKAPARFRGTQEVQEEALEQLAADQELQDSLEEEEEEDSTGKKESQELFATASQNSGGSMATAKQTQDSKGSATNAAAAKPPAFKRRTSSNRVSFGQSPPKKGLADDSELAPTPPLFAQPGKKKSGSLEGKSYGSRDRGVTKAEETTAAIQAALDGADSDVTMTPPDEIAVEKEASTAKAKTTKRKVTGQSPFRADDGLSPIGFPASQSSLNQTLETEQTFVGSQEIENDHDHDSDDGNGGADETGENQENDNDAGEKEESNEVNRDEEEKEEPDQPAGDEQEEEKSDEGQEPGKGGDDDEDEKDEKDHRKDTLYQESEEEDEEEEGDNEDLTQPMSEEPNAEEEQKEKSSREAAEEAGLGASYDRTIASITNLESHDSTKSAISDEATQPAGPKKGGNTKPKKTLFKNMPAEDEAPKKPEKEKGLDRKPPAKPAPTRGRRSTSRETNRQREPSPVDDEKEHAKSSQSESETDVPSSQDSHNEDEKQPAEAAASSKKFPVGTIVNVEARTWAGINKPGGVGRITKVNKDGTLNVAYVLGGKESNVAEIFLSKSEELEQAEKAPAPVAARRRRRPQDELPEDLLRELAKQGFDTGVAAPASSSSKKAKKRKESGGRGLSDSTNAQKPKASKKSSKKASGSKTTAASNRKRKSPTGFEDVASATGSTTKKKKAPQPKAKSTPKKESASKRPRKATAAAKEPASDPAPVEFSNEEAAKIADSMYEKRFSAALEAGLVNVAASGLSDDDAAVLKSLCAKTKSEDIRMKTTEAIGKKTTICVVAADSSDDDDIHIQANLRTSKIMKSSMEGVPMTTPEWLHECEEKGKIIPPTKFIRTLPTKLFQIEESGDAKYGVARMAALSQSKPKKSAMPFHNHFAFICGKLPADMRGLVVQLFKEGGGKVLATPADVSSKLDAISKPGSSFSKIMLLCGDSGVSLPKSLEQELTAFLESSPSPKIAAVVDYKWVMDSVTCAKVMPASLFEPSAKKELWKLSQE